MAFQRVQFQKFPKGVLPRTPLEVHAFDTHVYSYDTYVHLFHLRTVPPNTEVFFQR